MSELTEWQKSIVVQKDRRLGAIPAGFEWMIRFNNVDNINLDTFQDDFNLNAKGEGENSFKSIAEAVEQSYPRIKFKYKIFSDAREKIQFIKDLIDRNIPCMMKFSISYKNNVAHEMPAVIYDDLYMRFIWQVIETEKPNMLRVEYIGLANRHNKWGEGREVAWLEPQA